jgi:hypothetical protein
MKETKLISLLKTFTPAEIKDFEKFLASPYHNSGRNFKPLYIYLKRLYPEFPAEKLTDEKIFKKIYPKKKYVKKSSSLTIRVIFSQMVQMTEGFLQAEALRKNQVYKMSGLLRELNKRSKIDLMISYADKFEVKLDPGSFDGNYFFNRYLIKNELGIVNTEKKHKDVYKRLQNLDVATESLVMFLVYRLIEYTQMHSVNFDKNSPRSKLIEKFLKQFNIENFIKELERSESADADLLKMLYYSYRIVVDLKDSESFESLKTFFFKHIVNMNYEIKFEYLMKLMNFCIFEETGRKSFYRNEYSELYQIWIDESLKENIYHPFQVRAVRNIIRIYVRDKRFKEAEDYIRKYSKYIDSDIREDCINYAKSKIAFESGNNEKALEYSGKCNFTIPMMIKDIKFIKLQSFLQLNYFDAFRSETDTFRHFLANTSGIPANVIEYDKKVLKYFVKFAGIKEKNDEYEKELFYEELQKLNTKNDYLLWLISIIGNKNNI